MGLCHNKSTVSVHSKGLFVRESLPLSLIWEGVPPLLLILMKGSTIIVNFGERFHPKR